MLVAKINGQIIMQAPAHHISRKNWFYRYRLYHIPFWFMYHFVWWTVTVGSPLAVFNNLFTPYGIKFLFYIIFQAIAVYFNLYFLIPKYLEKNRFAIYIGLVLATIVCTAGCIASGYFFSSYLSGRSMTDLYGQNNYYYFFIVNCLPSTVASTTLGMSIKMGKNWLQTKRKQQALEKEKLETELKFLKNQFNPHYLFNTINSIFFLIHKNPDRASASLAKFSELLRYQLYECNDQFIPVSKEIGYLENFIELEKLRQNTNMNMQVNFQPLHGGDTVIAPFILMTFVENAFKHVSKHTDRDNWINIQLFMQGKQLTLQVANSASEQEHSSTLPYYGGIGLENVQRRLDLIYGGKYHLDISKGKETFEIKLQLDLTDTLQLRTLQKTA